MFHVEHPAWNVGSWNIARGTVEAWNMLSKARRQEKVHQVMGEFKRGQLRSGSKKGPQVTKKSQAIAIALNQARRGK